MSKTENKDLWKKLVWDVYTCKGNHLIIVENKRELTTNTIACPVCRNIAHYDGSHESLKEISEK